MTACEERDSSLQNYLYVLLLGQIMHGVGGQTLYSIGYVFIDANVRTKSSPVYQGLSDFCYYNIFGHNLTKAAPESGRAILAQV